MEIIRRLSVDQATERILRYIPELDNLEVLRYLRVHSPSGVAAPELQEWIRFFDQFVVDGRSMENGKSYA